MRRYYKEMDLRAERILRQSHTWVCSPVHVRALVQYPPWRKWSIHFALNAQTNEQISKVRAVLWQHGLCPGVWLGKKFIHQGLGTGWAISLSSGITLRALSESVRLEERSRTLGVVQTLLIIDCGWKRPWSWGEVLPLPLFFCNSQLFSDEALGLHRTRGLRYFIDPEWLLIWNLKTQRPLQFRELKQMGYSHLDLNSNF